MSDYIFCPLCGAAEWKANKMRDVAEGRLTRYECGECKKFIYSNLTRIVEHPLFVGITEVIRYSEAVTLGKYYISIFRIGLDAPLTTIRDEETMRIIVSLPKAIDFDWYREAKTLEKIKLYLVFS